MPVKLLPTLLHWILYLSSCTTSVSMSIHNHIIINKGEVTIVGNDKVVKQFYIKHIQYFLNTVCKLRV